MTTTGTRIDLPFSEGLHRREVELKECYLMLYETHLEYKVVAKYEIDDYQDKEGIWTATSANYRWTRKHRDIAQVEMYHDNPEDKWGVSFEFHGINNSPTWFFDNPKQALVLYKQLTDYFLSR